VKAHDMRLELGRETPPNRAMVKAVNGVSGSMLEFDIFVQSLDRVCKILVWHNGIRGEHTKDGPSDRSTFLGATKATPRAYTS
jgi:hypothetical protein